MLDASLQLEDMQPLLQGYLKLSLFHLTAA